MHKPGKGKIPKGNGAYDNGSGTNGGGSPRLPKGTVSNVGGGGKMGKPKSSTGY